MVFLSVTSDCRVQYSRVRLEVKIFDTPAGGIRAHQGTFSSIYEGCPKMPYYCIISLKFKTNISLIHMHPVGNLFLDILLKLHKIS